jgi:hypothetical protein
MMRKVAWIAGVLLFWVGWVFLRSGYLLMSDPGTDPFRDPKDPATGVRWMIVGTVLVVGPMLAGAWHYARRKAKSRTQ